MSRALVPRSRGEVADGVTAWTILHVASLGPLDQHATLHIRCCLRESGRVEGITAVVVSVCVVLRLGVA